MRKALAICLLSSLAVAFLIHPLVHAFEAHPDDCPVAAIQAATPGIAPQAAPVLAEPIFDVLPTLAPRVHETASISPLAFPSRGPPATA